MFLTGDQGITSRGKNVLISSIKGKQTAHFFLALLENATSLSRNLEDIVVNREHRLECTQQRPYVLIITISNDFGTSVTLALSVIVISLRFLVKVIRMIEIEEVSQPNELYRVLARFTFHLLCPL